MGRACRGCRWLRGESFPKLACGLRCGRDRGATDQRAWSGRGVGPGADHHPPPTPATLAEMQTPSAPGMALDVSRPARSVEPWTDWCEKALLSGRNPAVGVEGTTKLDRVRKLLSFGPTSWEEWQVGVNDGFCITPNHRERTTPQLEPAPGDHRVTGPDLACGSLKGDRVEPAHGGGRDRRARPERARATGRDR